MRLDSPRQARDIIDDDDMRIAPLLAQIGQHVLHARPLDQRAGTVIGKYLNDVIAFVARIFAAAGFLRMQTIALGGLLRIGNAAVNNRLLSIDVRHALESTPFAVSFESLRVGTVTISVDNGLRHATLPSGEDGGSKRKEAPNEGPHEVGRRLDALRARGAKLLSINVLNFVLFRPLHNKNILTY